MPGKKTKNKFFKTSVSLLTSDCQRAQPKIDTFFAGQLSPYLRHLMARDLTAPDLGIDAALPENEVELRAKLSDELQRLDAINQKLREIEKRKSNDRGFGGSATN